ncbi:hypothetical protein ACWDUX_34025 [Streptomyces sp. NPDC003444]
MSTAIWSALVGAGLLYEAYAIFNRPEGDTLSEKIRSLFHVRTKPGRAAFTALWSGFSVWFLFHIIFENM